MDIWVLSLDSDRTPQPFVQTRFAEEVPLISPNGRWLAYQSNESGRCEIYLSPFPNGGARFQVSSTGGFDPVWSHDGRELFFRYDDRIYGVTIADTAQLTTGEPRLLFRANLQGEGDALPDGRLLFLKAPEEEAAPRAIAIVLNWADELRERVKR